MHKSLSDTYSGEAQIECVFDDSESLVATIHCNVASNSEGVLAWAVWFFNFY